MKEFAIKFNNLDEMYHVVEPNEPATAPSIGSGKTKSEAMRNALALHKRAEQILKNGPKEDILILFNYEE